MSNRKSSRFDSNGFAHAMTNEYLRAAIAMAYTDVDPSEQVVVKLPVKCSDPSLYEGLFAKFGGKEPAIKSDGEIYTVSSGTVFLSGSTTYSTCLVAGLTVGDFLPV